MRSLPGTAPHCSPSKFWHAVEPIVTPARVRYRAGEGCRVRGAAALEIPSSRYSRISKSGGDCACAALFNLNYLAVNKAQWDRDCRYGWGQGRAGRAGSSPL